MGNVSPIRPNIIVACACGCTVSFRSHQQVTCLCGRTYGTEVNSREAKRIATVADRVLLQLRRRRADNEDILRRLKAGLLPRSPGSSWN